jgi:sialic acid synthase SpsE
MSEQTPAALFGDEVKVELIAEISTNAGGSVPLAKEFIHRFAEAGADYVKFQYTRVAHLSKTDPQYAWFQKAEFSLEQFAELKETCEQAGTKFLTTVYHHADVPEVASLGLEAVKIGSGEAHEESLAAAIGSAGFKRVIVGAGLTEPWESPFVELRRNRQRVQFLKCVTRYPCPSVMAQVRYAEAPMAWAAVPYAGWSDHCTGLAGCQLAILGGATVVEKHCCLPNQARAIKPYEATVAEFAQLRAFADEDPMRFKGWQHA